MLNEKGSYGIPEEFEDIFTEVHDACVALEDEYFQKYAQQVPDDIMLDYVICRAIASANKSHKKNIQVRKDIKNGKYNYRPINENMKKQTIKLNESQLRGLIKESIKKVLNEVSWQTAADVSNKRFDTVNKLRDLRGTRDLTQPELDLYKKSRINGNRDNGFAIEKLVDSFLSKYPNLEIADKYQHVPDEKGIRNTTCIKVKDKNNEQFWVDVWGPVWYPGVGPVELVTRDEHGDTPRCNIPQTEYVRKNLPELYGFYCEIQKSVGKWSENMGN